MSIEIILLCTGLIGLGLGLLGGGGAVLMVPLLVYGLSLSAADAVPTSLALVGVASLIGAILHARQGRIDYKAALSFGAAGMLGALTGAQFTPWFTSSQLLLTLAGLMLLIAIMMLLRKERQIEDCHQHIAKTLAVGLLVGVLTGFIGVGGGFMVVPALGIFACMPLKKAVGSSLLVTAMNSAAGLVGHWEAMPLPINTMLSLAATVVFGTVVGASLLGKLPVAWLRRAFAFVVLLVAVFLLWRNAPFI